jgi:hypothetical protein
MSSNRRTDGQTEACPFEISMKIRMAYNMYKHGMATLGWDGLKVGPTPILACNLASTRTFCLGSKFGLASNLAIWLVNFSLASIFFTYPFRILCCL